MSKRRNPKVTSIRIPTPNEVAHGQSLLQFDQKRSAPMGGDDLASALDVLRQHFSFRVV